MRCVVSTSSKLTFTTIRINLFFRQRTSILDSQSPAVDAEEDKLVSEVRYICLVSPNNFNAGALCLIQIQWSKSY